VLKPKSADKRFKISLYKASVAFRAAFSNADEIWAEFLTKEPYVIDRSPGLPYSNFMSRYFMKRALYEHGLRETFKPKREFRLLLDAFNAASKERDTSNIQRPTRKELQYAADRYIERLELRTEMLKADAT
jgi:hypothetical protein